MDMIKSLVISTFVVILIIALCAAGGQIQEKQKYQKRYELAKIDFEKSDLSSALRRLREDPPPNIAQDYYSLKFDILLNMERLEDAQDVAQKLVNMDGNNAFNQYLLSVAKYNMADYDSSEKCLKKAIKLDPKNSDYKIDLAGLYSDFHEDTKAIKYYEQVIKEDPQYEFAWAGIATIYENEKNYKKALVYRNEAVKEFPKNVYDVYMLGELYKAMGNKKSAALCYAKASEIDVNKETDSQKKYEKLTGKSINSAAEKINQKIPASFVGNYIVVDSAANGVKGKFIVDSNATDTILYEKFLRKNKIKVNTKEKGIYTLTNGRRNPAPTGYMDIKLGNLNFFGNRVFILPDYKDTHYDGIIGNDILAKTNFYPDEQNKVLVLKSLN
jgi:tetratricopeptide (TPR) repeat protein